MISSEMMTEYSIEEKSSIQEKSDFLEYAIFSSPSVSNPTINPSEMMILSSVMLMLSEKMTLFDSFLHFEFLVFTFYFYFNSFKML